MDVRIIPNAPVFAAAAPSASLSESSIPLSVPSAVPSAADIPLFAAPSARVASRTRGAAKAARGVHRAALAPRAVHNEVPDADPSLIILPPELATIMQELENWVVSNQEEADKYKRNFWTLKILAASFSGLSALFIAAHIDYSVIPTSLGFAGSICIVIDGYSPRDNLHNFSLKAVYDIRLLEHDITDEWNKGKRNKEDEDALVSKLITMSQQKRREISDYLKQAETTLGTKYKPID